MKSSKIKKRLRKINYGVMSLVFLGLSISSASISLVYALQDSQVTTVAQTGSISREDAIKQVLGEELNEQRKIQSKDDITPSDDLLRAASQVDGKSVRMVYANLLSNVSDTLYEITLDETQNIIYIKNKSESVFIEGINIHDLFRLSMSYSPEFISNTDHGFLTDTVSESNGYQNDGTYLRGSSGYNGFIEFIIASTPVVFYNDSSLEPRLTPEQAQKVEDLVNGITSDPVTPPSDDVIITPPNVSDENTSVDDTNSFPSPDYVYPEYPEYEEDVTTDDYLDPVEPNIDSTYDDSYAGPGVFEDDSITSGTDSNTTDIDQGIIQDYNTSEVPTDDFWVEDTTYPEEDYKEGGNYKPEEIPVPNKGYKPVWGTTETGNHLKENIKDGKEILERVYNRPVLNVIDIRGNLVDLDKKTKETKPAEFRRQEPILVGNAVESKDVTPIVMICSITSLICLVGFFICANQYYKEAIKEVKLKEVLEEDTTIIESSNFDEILENKDSSATLVHSALNN